MPGGHLTIVLPGRAYHAEGAAIRLVTLTLEGRGARTHVVTWPDEIADAWAVAELTAVLGVERPDHVTFVAKSLGSVVLAKVYDRLVLPDATDVVWVTPIFGDASVRLGALAFGRRSLVVAGDADPTHDPDAHESVVLGLGADEVVVPGADHCLEVAGDVDATLAGWRSLADAVARWAPHPD